MKKGTAVEEVVSREVYNTVILIAAVPALIFVVWLSWIITNRLMSPEWQQARRNKQIRKAVSERAALMSEIEATKANDARNDQR